MTLNIIHLSHRRDRLKLLLDELNEQSINNYILWEGIVDSQLPFRGVSKAHKKIIRYAADHNLESVLIAEDDVKFTAPGAFDFYLSKIPMEFDLYLGGITFGKIKQDYSVEDFSGTMLYIAHERFYSTILNMPEDQHIDRALQKKGKYLVCHPMVAIQHNGYSDNNKREVDFSPYFANRQLFGRSSL